MDSEGPLFINRFIGKLDYSNVQKIAYQGPIVQSIISLTSSLVVKISTVLVSTISDSSVFLLKKCE